MAGLALHGPIANVSLARPARTAEETQQTSSIQIKMLVDTGAFKTVIDRGIPESLGLDPIRFEQMIGVSHVPEECPVFLLSIAIGLSDGDRQTVLRFTSEMIGMTTPPSPRPFNGLLGRDFLRFVRLEYNGPSGYCDIIGNLPETKSGHHGGHSGHSDEPKSSARKKGRR